MKALPVGTELTFAQVKILFASKEGYQLKRRVTSSGSTIIERHTPKGVCDNRFIVSKEYKFSIDTLFRFSESDDSDEKCRIYFCKQVKVYQLEEIVEADTLPTISVSPTKISSNPDLKISLIDGEYRYFENHFVNGKQYSFGFPKENCTDRRVWVGIGKEEIERISKSEAIRRIGNKNYTPNQTKIIGSSNHEVGYCTICNKKLRGDIYKKKCFECYTNKTTTSQKVGYCANCNKKLRGNIYKKHCTECYHNGHR